MTVRLSIGALLFLLVCLAAPARGRADDAGCLDALRQVLRVAYPKTDIVVASLEDFARKYNLPTKIIEVGPMQRRVKRLVVGLDVNNKEAMAEYLKLYNLDTPVGGDVKGSLVLEFADEQSPDAYVTGVLRTSADPEGKIYRWGRPDLKRTDWWQNWLMPNRVGAGPRQDPVLGYSHIIPLDEPERQNVHFFLDHPKARGKCKSDNCVAWTSGIELGVTQKGSTDAERKFLFSQLGVSRAMAHFEIGRRLIHAADQNHGGIVAFLNGQKGLDAFPTIEKVLPPEPKIPYESIIKNLSFPADSEIMKAISQIPDGSKVFVPIAAGASPEGVTALIQQAARAEKGFDVHVLVNGVSEATLRRGADISDNKFRLHSLFLGGNQRKLYQEGKIDYVPGYLSDFARFVNDPAHPEFQYDAIMVRVAPADAAGHYSLGPNADMLLDIIRKRPGIKIIAEVNPNIPRTTGENFITESQITAKFHSVSALAGPPVVPYTEVERNIGLNLGKLIDNGAHLQVGIGNVFGGLPDGLAAAGRKDLHIWSEMFGDPLKQVMEKGMATDAKTGFAYGSDNLYKWLDGNKAVEFHPTSVINDPGAVEKMDHFDAVNTALQVDLRGDVNATMGADGVRMSSPGGQVEFMSGAARSPGGKAIIAIRSTAKQGTISSITMDLYPGPVTTPHESVTEVVTEYGIAELAGKSERALALINIANPRFRKQLATQAVERKLITADDAKAFENAADLPQIPDGYVAPAKKKWWQFWKKRA